MAARVTWLGHSTVLIELDGIRILTDPVLRRRVAHLRRRAEPLPAPGRLDAVLLSHLHRDHADVPTLRGVAHGVPVFGPRGTAAALRRAGRRDVREIGPGDRMRLAGDVAVHGVPARHDGRRHPLAPTTDALGFVVAGAQRIYFAGDTDLFAGMAEIASGGLDVALLPVWGWGPSLGAGHLDPERAGRAAAILRPKIAIPIHWGTYLPIGLGRRHRRLLEWPGHAFARAVAQQAPEVQVAVLAPGEGIDVRAHPWSPASARHVQ